MCSFFFLIKLNSETVFKSIVMGLCRVGLYKIEVFSSACYIFL